MIGKGTGKIWNKRTSRDHPDYNINKIDQNTKQGSWRLEETCCLSNFCEKPIANAGVKDPLEEGEEESRHSKPRYYLDKPKYSVQS